ncbi:hypothetical protein DIPPA_23775 [Diplonema papillatum]|nr:hypothetical protein DIPPA_23775 [Diplonema papillatum]
MESITLTNDGSLTFMNSVPVALQRWTYPRYFPQFTHAFFRRSCGGSGGHPFFCSALSSASEATSRSRLTTRSILTDAACNTPAASSFARTTSCVSCVKFASSSAPCPSGALGLASRGGAARSLRSSPPRWSWRGPVAGCTPASSGAGRCRRSACTMLRESSRAARSAPPSPPPTAQRPATPQHTTGTPTSTQIRPIGRGVSGQRACKASPLAISFFV